MNPEVVARRLLATLAEPFQLAGFEGIPLTTSASIGIATGQRASADDLLRDADIALYRAKAAGKGCQVVFESFMQSEVLDRLELELDLRAGLCEQFFIAYQPVFDLATLEVTGVEALLRWNHLRDRPMGPSRGLQAGRELAQRRSTPRRLGERVDAPARQRRVRARRA